jgi:hypothetical protein
MSGGEGSAVVLYTTDAAHEPATDHAAFLFLRLGYAAIPQLPAASNRFTLLLRFRPPAASHRNIV